MAKTEKLFKKVKQAPKNCRFGDLVTLMERTGFVLNDQKGSHRVYIHPQLERPYPIQNDGGQAIPYQVRAVVGFIEDLGLLEG